MRAQGSLQLLATHQKLVDLALNIRPGLASLHAVGFVVLKPVQFVGYELQLVPEVFLA